MSWFQSNFSEVFLLWPFTKIAKIVPLSWTKWPPELKIEKNNNKKTSTLNVISFASGLISKWFHRNVPLIPLFFWLRLLNILDISYFGHLLYKSVELMKSIRVPSRHKIAKWADRKSKMAATVAILKISFQHLFPDLWLVRAETCSVATGWLLDPNELKLCG